MSRYYKTYRNDPVEITARRDSKCAETGKQIKQGEVCVYYPRAKSVYHVESKTAYDFRTARADWQMGYEY